MKKEKLTENEKKEKHLHSHHLHHANHVHETDNNGKNCCGDCKGGGECKTKNIIATISLIKPKNIQENESI
jgi:hypothetical protein